MIIADQNSDEMTRLALTDWIDVRFDYSRRLNDSQISSSVDSGSASTRSGIPIGDTPSLNLFDKTKTESRFFVLNFDVITSNISDGNVFRIDSSSDLSFFREMKLEPMPDCSISGNNCSSDLSIFDEM